MAIPTESEIAERVVAAIKATKPISSAHDATMAVMGAAIYKELLQLAAEGVHPILLQTVAEGFMGDIDARVGQIVAKFMKSGKN